MPRKALIVGVGGVVGLATAAHMADLDGWRCVGVSRSACALPAGVEHLRADILGSADCERVFRAHPDITHIIFAAVFEKPSIVSGWTDDEHISTNLRMLTTLLDAAAALAPALQHVTLLQGTKAYGVHLGPIRVPARETDPRTLTSNFYYEQEDWLRAKAAEKGWRWSVLRPQSVIGYARGNPMNMLMAIGVYAAVARELAIPFCFSGTPGCLQEATDADLLAKAIVWAGTTEACDGEIFNITNGDAFVWSDLWPHLAEVLGVACGQPRSFSLEAAMRDKGPVWDRVVALHGLQPLGFAEAVGNWGFADFVFRYRQPQQASIMSTVKARRFGFGECVDTQEMFASWLKRLQAMRILPPAHG